MSMMLFASLVDLTSKSTEGKAPSQELMRVVKEDQKVPYELPEPQKVHKSDPKLRAAATSILLEIGLI